jgi:hypothetical protein
VFFYVIEIWRFFDFYDVKSVFILNFPEDCGEQIVVIGAMIRQD